MKTKRIKAFTVFELVLGMLLSAIVIGMIYTCYFIFTRIYANFSQSNLARAEIKLFQHTISRDVVVAANLSVEQNQLLLRDEQGKIMISYLLHDDYVIRISAVRDTFQLKQLRFQSEFEGLEKTKGTIDRVTCYFLYDGLPGVVIIHKKYASDELFH